MQTPALLLLQIASIKTSQSASVLRESDFVAKSADEKCLPGRYYFAAWGIRIFST